MAEETTTQATTETPVATENNTTTETVEAASAPTAEIVVEPEKTVPLKALEDERRKRQELKEQLAYFKGLAEANKQPEPVHVEATHDVPPVEPNIEQFAEDYEAFERAQRRYVVDLAKYELRQETRQQAERTKELQTQEQIDANWNKSVKTAQSKYPDFMEAIANPEFKQSDAVAQAIKSSEIGGDVAYYLAHNIEIANNLNAMNPLQAAREIGKIEAKIINKPKADPAPVISQAPDPITTVVGSGSGEAVPLEDLPMEEFFRRRAPEIVRRRY